MKNKFTLTNVLALIPLGFLCLCGFFLGCGSGGGSSSSSSSTDDTTTETAKISRTVRVIVDNNSGQAISAYLFFTDENLTKLNFVDIVVPVGGEETATRILSSVELYLLEENVDVSLNDDPPPSADDTEIEFKFDIFVTENTVGGADIEYRVVVRS